VSTILFAWELGGGLGHITQIAPLATDLAARGHRVHVALRDLSAAATVFAGTTVQFLPGPFRPRGVLPSFKPTVSFAHVLHNIGFGDEASLAAHASAWRNLYRFTRPDLIVFDHSPTALLAARGAPARLAVIGSGFCVPPDADPFPPMETQEQGADVQRLHDEEQPILRRVNRLLDRWRQPPLARLGQLYSEVHHTFLTTFRELDHYPGRPDGVPYYGPINATGGAAPEWPDAPGKRIYAYLKDFPALPELLGCLVERRVPTLVYADGVRDEVRRRFAGPTLRFERRRLDLSRAARECDLAITNANHGTTAALLMAGRPLLQLPLVLEQSIMARKVFQLGAGLGATGKRPAVMLARLHTMLESDRFREAASGVAQRLAGFDPASRRQEMSRRAEELLDQPASDVANRSGPWPAGEGAVARAALGTSQLPAGKPDG
jgi:hypothetical protein